MQFPKPARDGTSPGNPSDAEQSAAPNYDEGRVGESRADFIHKINIALKELVKTSGWLKFVVIAELISAKRIQPLLEECDQLIKIPAKSVATAKSRR